MTTTVRTFRAADARSALAAVKAALGPGAVILSTAEVPGGLFKKPQVEVTAGLAEAPAPAAAPVAAVNVPPKMTKASVGAVTPPVTRVTPDESPLNGEFQAMRVAMDAMRHELRAVVTGQRAAVEHEMAPAAAALFAHLRMRGFEDAVAEELARTPDDLYARVGDWLVGGRAPWLADRQQRVFAMVGPTGVGKTTTLAKIGARALIESRQKVALITIDTYRIGAAEQLSRYGQIMNVPAFVAKDAGELKRALEKTASADLVLIDTAGRSTEDAIAKQTALLQAVPGIRLQLVLAATASAAQLASVAERYKALKPERVIFTKLDEAVAPGGIVSAAARISRPVACFTDGQQVPEDLHAVAGTTLVERVIGSWTSGS